jgi:hypothetical protein
MAKKNLILQKLIWLARQNTILDFILNLTPANQQISCNLKGCGCKFNPFIWVSHKHRLVFYEIPKTGSTSVKRLLGIKLNLGQRLYWRILKQNYKCLTKPFLGYKTGFGFQPIYGIPPQAKALFPRYTHFAVIRHPVERALSCYRMFCEQSNFRRAQRMLMKGATCDKGPAHFILSCVNHHLNPQFVFLPNEPQQNLDIILRTEHLFHDWQLFANNTGLPTNLPHLNKTKDTRINNINHVQMSEIIKRYMGDFNNFHNIYSVKTKYNR